MPEILARLQARGNLPQLESRCTPSQHRTANHTKAAGEATRVNKLQQQVLDIGNMEPFQRSVKCDAISHPTHGMQACLQYWCNGSILKATELLDSNIHGESTTEASVRCSHPQFVEHQQLAVTEALAEAQSVLVRCNQDKTKMCTPGGPPG